MAPMEPEIRSAIDRLAPHDHLCLIYEDEDQWRNAVVPFLATGLGRGEKCIYVADAHSAEQVRALLSDDGVDVPAAEGSSQLTFLRDKDAYTRGGRFEPARMIALLQAETEAAVAEGYPALRVTGEMTWALRECAGSDALLEYEALLNHDLFPDYPCLALCQYDRRRFDAETLKGVVMTHPWLIHGDKVLRDFYYIPPAEFLAPHRAEHELTRWLDNLAREHAGQERYSSLYQAMNEGMALHELVFSASGEAVDYRIIDANAAFERITGIDREQAVGALASQLFGTGYAPYLEIYARAVRTGAPVRFETTFEPMAKVFRVSVFSPAPGQFATVFDDITERVRLEEQARRWTEELEKRAAERTAALEATAEQLRHSVEQARRLAQHLQSVREEERTAVAREVHDELGQSLTGLKMDLAWALSRLEKPDAAARAAEVAGRIEAMSGLVDSTIQAVRRIATDLRPGVLDALGLVAAAEWQTREFGARAQLACDFDCSVEDMPLNRDCSTALFRIQQEALTNVARHAQATRVLVSLTAVPDGVQLLVSDDGKGIGQEALSADTSLGLLGMRERMLVFGGDVSVRGIPGRGTEVKASLPCPCLARRDGCPDGPEWCGGEARAADGPAAAVVVGAEARARRPRPPAQPSSAAPPQGGPAIEEGSEPTETPAAIGDVDELNARLRTHMSEMRHRVKSHLQTIAALIDMQQMEEQASVPIAELERVGRHVRGLAAIFDLLTHEARAGGDAEAVNGRDLLEELEPLFRTMVRGRPLRFRVEDVMVPLRQATGLAVLVNELVSNAVRHGGGAIDLALAVSRGRASLRVRDHGPGFPRGFDPAASAHTGLELVQRVSTWDLRGDVQFGSAPGGGACVTVRFPIRESATPER